MMQFFRQILIDLVIESPEEKQGFSFLLKAGFVKAMNSETGMTANLVLVDQWLSHLKNELQKNKWKNEEQVLHFCQKYLASNAQQDQTQLETCELTDIQTELSYSWSGRFAYQINQKFILSFEDKDQVKRTCHYRVGCKTLKKIPNNNSVLESALAEYLTTKNDRFILEFINGNPHFSSIQIDSISGQKNLLTSQVMWQVSAI